MPELGKIGVHHWELPAGIHHVITVEATDGTGLKSALKHALSTTDRTMLIPYIIPVLGLPGSVRMFSPVPYGNITRPNPRTIEFWAIDFASGFIGSARWPPSGKKQTRAWEVHRLVTKDGYHALVYASWK